VKDGRHGSASHRARTLDGVHYARWIRSEEAARDRGEEHYVPDWSLYNADGDGYVLVPSRPGKDQESSDVSPTEHAQARARSLASEITGLVTRSLYPLINPEAIIVDSYVTRRYDRATKSMVIREGTPNTWLTDTLKVASISDHKGRKFLFTGAQNDAPSTRSSGRTCRPTPPRSMPRSSSARWTYETQWWSENNPTARTYDRAEETTCASAR
jgi:hypothetical protein